MYTFTPFPDCTNGDVSLVGGGSAREGRVEICVNGTWVTACEDSFDANGAVIICNQLGYPGLGVFVLKCEFQSFRIILIRYFNTSRSCCYS